MKNDMSFKYVGKGVEDGSIEAPSLVYGLRGLVKVSDVILDAYEPRKKNASLRIKSFNKGSFDTILIFIENHPVLITSTALLVAATIPSLSNIFINTRKTKKLIRKGVEEVRKEMQEALRKEVETLRKEVEKVLCREVEGALRRVLGSDTSTRKARKGFHDMALPLNEDGIDVVKFGLIKSPKEIINQENKDCFLEDIDKEETYRAVTLTGELRSLDKKTLNGRFVTNDKDTYSISLAMASPKKYFNYFDKGNITISGIATYEKGSNKIIRVVIEQIR